MRKITHLKHAIQIILCSLPYIVSGENWEGALGSWERAHWEGEGEGVGDRVYERALREVGGAEGGGGLAKGYGEAALRDWIVAVEGAVGAGVRYRIEWKLDGVNVRIGYEGAGMVGAWTRSGRELGKRVAGVDGVPMALAGLAGRLEVKGELVVKKAALAGLRMADGRAPTQGRHWVVGQVNGEGGLAQARLEYWVHGWERDGALAGLETAAQVEAQLGGLGFRVVGGLATGLEGGEVWAAVEALKARRGEWAYATDGLVVKVEDLRQRAALGVNSTGVPRWAYAVKHPDPEVMTRLVGYEVRVGETGRVTCVGLLEPVEVDGATIARVVLHGAARAAGVEFGVGDWVIVRRRGGTVPQFVRHLPELRDEDSVVEPLAVRARLEAMGAEVEVSAGGVLRVRR